MWRSILRSTMLSSSGREEKSSQNEQKHFYCLLLLNYVFIYLFLGLIVPTRMPLRSCAAEAPKLNGVYVKICLQQETTVCLHSKNSIIVALICPTTARKYPLRGFSCTLTLDKRRMQQNTF